MVKKRGNSARDKAKEKVVKVQPKSEDDGFVRAPPGNQNDTTVKEGEPGSSWSLHHMRIDCRFLSWI